MELKQLDLFGGIAPKIQKPVDKARRNWLARFQRWSNREAEDETTSTGICGWGSMCDYCTDNHIGNPCARALAEMCREEQITIDYEHSDYLDVWNGKFCEVEK